MRFNVEMRYGILMLLFLIFYSWYIQSKENIEISTSEKNITIEKEISNTLSKYCNISNEKCNEYATYIEEASKRFGITPGIITGLIIAESSGKCNASSGIAHGLMQVRWDIHGNNIKSAFSEIKCKKDFLEPRNNIMVGTWIFSCYLNSCNGDYYKALRKYSGGANEHYYVKIFSISNDFSRIIVNAYNNI